MAAVQETATLSWLTEVVARSIGVLGAGIWLVVTEIEADGLAPPVLTARMYRVWSVFGVKLVKV